MVDRDDTFGLKTRCTGIKFPGLPFEMALDITKLQMMPTALGKWDNVFRISVGSPVPELCFGHPSGPPKMIWPTISSLGSSWQNSDNDENDGIIPIREPEGMVKLRYMVKVSPLLSTTCLLLERPHLMQMAASYFPQAAPAQDGDKQNLVN
jgi:hypothetical protein